MALFIEHHAQHLYALQNHLHHMLIAVILSTAFDIVIQYKYIHLPDHYGGDAAYTDKKFWPAE
jgi:hypothetical protein